MSRWSLVAEEGHQLPRGSWEWHPQLTSLWVDGALGAEYNPQARVGSDQGAQSLSS